MRRDQDPSLVREQRHWKHNATRCAVVGCDRTRRKGWSTCDQVTHYIAGRSLYGAGRIDPITLNADGTPVAANA